MKSHMRATLITIHKNDTSKRKREEKKTGGEVPLLVLKEKNTHTKKDTQGRAVPFLILNNIHEKQTK